jgi:hypothetical protein
MLQTTSCALKIKCVQDLVYQLPQKDGPANLVNAFPDDLETLAGRIKNSVLLVISKDGH